MQTHLDGARRPRASMLVLLALASGIAFPALVLGASPEPAGPVVAQSMEPEPPLSALWHNPAPEGMTHYGVAVSPDGAIWVTGGPSGQFAIYGPDGTLRETWGSPGDDEGEFDFNAPWNEPFGGIAFRPDGGFYVSDTGNVRVQQFAPDRTFVREWGGFGTADGEFVAPVDIKLDGAGNVYVQDIERWDTQVFDPDGAYLRTINTDDMVTPTMAVDGDGNVYVVSGPDLTLQRIRPDGTIESIAILGTVLTVPTGIALRPDGGFVVASELSSTSITGPERLVQLDAAGNVLHLWPDGGWAIAIDPSGSTVYLPMMEHAPDPGLRALELPAE